MTDDELIKDVLIATRAKCEAVHVGSCEPTHPDWETMDAEHCSCRHELAAAITALREAGYEVRMKG